MKKDKFYLKKIKKLKKKYCYLYIRYINNEYYNFSKFKKIRKNIAYLKTKLNLFKNVK